MKIKLILNSKFHFAAAIYCIFFGSVFALAGNQQDVKAELDKRMAAWGKYVGGNPRLSDLTSNEYYDAVVELGVPALPYMFDKVEEGSWVLGDAVAKITRRHFEEAEWPGGRLGDPKGYARLYVDWWDGGYKKTPKQFEERYRRWRQFKQANKHAEAEKEYRRMIWLGIAALPNMMEKVKAGDSEIVAAISDLVDGAVEKDANISDCNEWWQANEEAWTIPFPEGRASYSGVLIMIIVGGIGVAIAAGVVLVVLFRKKTRAK